MSDQIFFFIAKSINYRIFTNTPANDFFENHEIIKIVFLNDSKFRNYISNYLTIFNYFCWNVI